MVREELKIILTQGEFDTIIGLDSHETLSNSEKLLLSTGASIIRFRERKYALHSDVANLSSGSHYDSEYSGRDGDVKRTLCYKLSKD